MIITPFYISTVDTTDTQKVYVYNTLTTSLISLPLEDFERIFVKKTFNESEKKMLFEQGFIIKSKEDALAQLKRFKNRDSSKMSQIVTILTTTDCNARCYYCFEHGIDHYYMNNDVADSVISFLKHNFKNKELGINWFGGEPLLNFKIIKYITENLLRNGFVLSCHLTTNGSLLTEDIVDYLIEHYQRVTAQITIDDVDDKYGKVKKYINIDNDTIYNKIINNISLLANKNILVSVRINFASTHIKEAKEIYNRVQRDLEEKCSKNNLYIYFAPLSLKDPKENISEYRGKDEHPYLQAVKIQFKEGYPVNKLKYPENYDLLAAFGLMPHSSACGMNVENRFAIDANGDLYKCHRLVGKKAFRVGNVFDNVDKQNKYYKMYVNDEIDDPECLECNILPICQTGCKANRLLIGDYAKCHKIKQSQKELLRIYCNILKKKGYEL